MCSASIHRFHSYSTQLHWHNSLQGTRQKWTDLSLHAQLSLCPSRDKMAASGMEFSILIDCEFIAVVSWKVGWLYFLHKICTRLIGRQVSQFYSSMGCFYPSGMTGRVVSWITAMSQKFLITVIVDSVGLSVDMFHPWFSWWWITLTHFTYLEIFMTFKRLWSKDGSHIPRVCIFPGVEKMKHTSQNGCADMIFTHCVSNRALYLSCCPSIHQFWDLPIYM